MENRPTILLADDEEAITAELRPFLERAGFAVLLARDGEAALRIARANDPDLIVLDVLMPHLDGGEVLRRMRSDERWNPVVLLTQVGAAGERAMALEEGADDYLSKPFDPGELVARIRAVLRRARPGRPPLAATRHLTSGELRLDGRALAWRARLARAHRHAAAQAAAAAAADPASAAHAPRPRAQEPPHRDPRRARQPRHRTGQAPNDVLTGSSAHVGGKGDLRARDRVPLVTVSAAAQCAPVPARVERVLVPGTGHPGCPGPS